MENPLKSRKTGLSNQTGKFGRGLQGFRGFCRTLTYISLRSKVNESECNFDVTNEQLKLGKTKGHDGRCIKLSLTKENIAEVKSQGKTIRRFIDWKQDANSNPVAPSGHTLVQSAVDTKYVTVDVKEFRKHSDSKTGTVAIFSDWIPGEFEELLRDKKKTIQRIQHHFQVPIEKGLVEISYKLNNEKAQLIPPRRWEAKNDKGEMEELDLYEIPNRQIINPHTKEVIGTLEIRLYKCNPNFNQPFNAPYLLVGDRPLGDSTLHEMTHFRDKKILKSPYVAGYVRADFLKPDTQRLNPLPGEELKQFHAHMDKIIDDELEPLVKEQSAAWREVDKDDANEKLRLEATNYLRAEFGDHFDSIQSNELGVLFPNNSIGGNKSKRISNESGTENQGQVVKNSKFKAVIRYKKRKNKKQTTKTGKKSGEKTKDEDKGDTVTRTEVILPSKDGRTGKKVYINPNLGSKGGRTRDQSNSDPGLDTYRAPFDPNLSKWDAGEYKVLVNEKNETSVLYETERATSPKYQNKVYSKKQENLMLERYYWHFVQECGRNPDGSKMTPDEKTKLFWKIKYKFFLKR
jgi:hypothetical protein